MQFVFISGCSSVLHGHVDVMLGSEVPLVVAEDSEENCEGNNMDFPSKFKDQLIAQSIVLSFLQKKDKSKYENYLIPIIGIAKTQFVLFLYDSVNGILLESNVLQLWNHPGKLIPSAVLALWLAINPSVTSSGVTEHMKDLGFTADFPKHVGKELERYEKSYNLVVVKEREIMNCLCGKFTAK